MKEKRFKERFSFALYSPYEVAVSFLFSLYFLFGKWPKRYS
ncbi:MAG: hypothetical protein ACJAZC_002742 [Cryomorphaceae bacterium]|jgi:hypothetical protein